MDCPTFSVQFYFSVEFRSIRRLEALVADLILLLICLHGLQDTRAAENV